jgi:hypothetical protein
MLHREDYYEPESERSGETDLIVAKHRNGPTATVTVAHQFHYSRLRDMSGAEEEPCRFSNPVSFLSRRVIWTSGRENAQVSSLQPAGPAEEMTRI